MDTHLNCLELGDLEEDMSLAISTDMGENEGIVLLQHDPFNSTNDNARDHNLIAERATSITYTFKKHDAR